MAYESYSSPPGVGLAVLRPDGVLTDTVAIRGDGSPKVTYHAALDTAVVLADSGVTWLDGLGKVAGDSAVDGTTYGPDVMPTPEGFLGLCPAANDAKSDPIRYAPIEANPKPPNWQVLDSGGPFSVVHSEDDLGYGKWIVSWKWTGTPYRLFEVASPAPLAVRTLDSRLPEVAGGGEFEALFEDGGLLYGIFGGVLQGTDQQWGMWLVDLTISATASWRLDRSPNGPDAAVLRLGSDLVLASSAIHPDSRMSIAQLRPGNPEPLEGLQVLGGEGKLSRSASLALTPQGFAVAWWEGTHIGESIRLQLFDCRVRPTPSP
jgi:hypothetical protein